MNEIILLTITTSLGSFDIELYQKEAPITANNFVEYVEQNFYENTLFHRVIPGFVIQGGGFEIGMSPKKTNPPIKNEADNGLKNDKYTLSMARTQDLDSATSQFFINLTDSVLVLFISAFSFSNDCSNSLEILLVELTSN